MLKRFIILIAFKSRQILFTIVILYYVIIKILKNTHYEGELPKFYYYILFFLIGISVGFRIMANIIQYLSKIENRNHPTLFQYKRNKFSKK